MPIHTASLSLVACLALPLGLAAAQLPGVVPREKEPPTRTRMQEKHIALTVSGCVRGKRLLLSSSSFADGMAALFDTDEFILEGPKDLMQQLRKEHEGHDDELTGVAILKPTLDDSSTTEVQSKPIGKNGTKGRITLGVHESSGPTQGVRQPVRFRVSSVRHVHDNCARF